MTRLDLFKKWLEEQGADFRDCEMLDGLGDYDVHGCLGFICPGDVPVIVESLANTGMPNCNLCKYNQFWTKEVGE